MTIIALSLHERGESNSVYRVLGAFVSLVETRTQGYRVNSTVYVDVGYVVFRRSCIARVCDVQVLARVEEKIPTCCLKHVHECTVKYLRTAGSAPGGCAVGQLWRWIFSSFVKTYDSL